MEQPKVTFVINGQTFSLRASDSSSIDAIPAPERQQLVELLEAVKQRENRAATMARQALEKAAVATTDSAGSARPDYQSAKPERMGSGDVDALMARLVMEENRNRKPGMTRQDLYKWVLGGAAIVILLVLLL